MAATVAFATLRDGLAALFARLSGVPLACVGERDTGARKRERGGTGARLDFVISGRRTVGQDELRTEYDPDVEIEGDEHPGDLGGVVYSACGNRLLVVDVAVECEFSQVPALAYIQNVIDKLSLPSAQAELKALGVALNRVSEAFDASYDDETGHAVTAYACEIQLNASSLVADDPVTTIETVNADTDTDPA